LLRHQASDADLVSALRHAEHAMRIGHLSFWERDQYTCSGLAGAGDSTESTLGACAVPRGQDFLVTATLPGNALGLHPGDLIEAVDGRTGAAMYDLVLDQPACGAGTASDQARREEAARSLFSALPAGTPLSVRALDGTETTVSVPAQQNDRLWCGDPLGRNTNFVARAHRRSDGVAVIDLPSFAPPDGFTDENWEAEMAVFQREIQDVFTTVSDAPALIWDVRSNLGGASPVAFAIAAGMPGARPMPIARCSTRIAGTDPPAYRHAGPDYDLVPGSEFDYAGRVAILIDGRTLSAGDYFALAVKTATDALVVGTPSSGAFGGIGNVVDIATDPNLVVGYDPYRCDDVSGQPLETHGTEPDLRVEYDPTDIAAGVDTVLEAAAAALLTP